MLRNRKLLVFIILALVSITCYPSFSEAINYTYDDLNRLRSVEYDDGSSVGYIYDEVGNLVQTSTTPVSWLLSISNVGTGSGIITANSGTISWSGSTGTVSNK